MQKEGSSGEKWHEIGALLRMSGCGWTFADFGFGLPFRPGRPASLRKGRAGERQKQVKSLSGSLPIWGRGGFVQLQADRLASLPALGECARDLARTEVGVPIRP